jgi:hypothetical protein
MGNPAGGAVVSGGILIRMALFLTGAVMTAAGILVLAWMVWISSFAGFANFNLVKAMDDGHVSYALEHYAVVAFGILFIWCGSRIARRRDS